MQRFVILCREKLAGRASLSAKLARMRRKRLTKSIPLIKTQSVRGQLPPPHSRKLSVRTRAPKLNMKIPTPRSGSAKPTSVILALLLAAILPPLARAEVPESRPVLEFAVGLPGKQVKLTWTSEPRVR